MMSKKMAELEDDFREFKAHTERRFVSLDMSIRAYRLEEDQRHEEEYQRHEERIRSFRENENNRNVNSGLGDGTNFKANDYRFKKLKMPIFDGDDAYGWIFRMERFFKIQGVEALEQLQVAKLCLEGEALSWYCWSEGRSSFRSWEGLKRRLLNRFQQTQQVLEAAFIKGLKSDLRLQLELCILKGGISTGRVSQFKRLTEAELADKRSKGLCLHMNQKSSRSCCVSRSLQVLLVDEEEEYEEEDGEELKMAMDHVHLDMVEVSLNSVMGFTPNRTMKLRRKIGDREVAVLIDCGATHNFISSKIVEELRLAVSDSGTFIVTLGNGETTRSKGICKGLVVVFPEIQVFEDFLLLELSSTDAILGIKWLQTLRDVKMNMKLLTMKFMVGLGEVTLCGDPCLYRSKLSLKAMEKSLTANAECYLVELKELGAHKSSHQGVNTEPFKKLLLQFEDVFNMPFGLPPTRAHEHA
ncbi:putative mitochondrial protein [Tanacetum coccineum]